MKIKKVQSVCLILACVVASGLIGCGKTYETPKKHEAITFMAPYLDIDSFIEEVHKTYPEIELEVVPYSGANTTTYLQNMLEADDLPDICTQTFYKPDVVDVSDKMIDLSGYDFTDNYVESRLKEVSDEGALYMLPSLYNCYNIAEIAPSNIRGTLVSCNQFAIIFGMLVVYFVNFLIMGDHQNPIILKDAAGVLSVSAESDMWTVYEGWRYMFGSEAFPAAFFGLLLFFVPKTPRYLVLIQQDEKAYSILEKINGKTKAQEILNDIKATAHEKTEKIFTYGVAVIVIGILLSVFQQAIGINAVLYYAPRIFENAGAEGGGMMQTVIMGIVNIVFTLVAIFTVDRFGRKPLLIIGSIGMAVGAFAVAMCDSMAIKGILPVLSVIVYAAFFMMSWGPICWVLISEIFPNTIRGKAVAIAVAFQWIFNYIVSSTFPALYDFSPMFAYSLYGIICVAAAIFVWRWVPETKGKTLEDMSKLWKKNK